MSTFLIGILTRITHGAILVKMPGAMCQSASIAITNFYILGQKFTLLGTFCTTIEIDGNFLYDNCQNNCQSCTEMSFQFLMDETYEDFVNNFSFDLENDLLCRRHFPSMRSSELKFLGISTAGSIHTRQFEGRAISVPPPRRR